MGCHHRIKYFEELVQALIQGQGNTYVEYNPPHVPGPDKFPKRLVFLGEGGLGLLLGSLFCSGDWAYGEETCAVSWGVIAVSFPVRLYLPYFICSIIEGKIEKILQYFALNSDGFQIILTLFAEEARSSQWRMAAPRMMERM